MMAVSLHREEPLRLASSALNTTCWNPRYRTVPAPSCTPLVDPEPCHRPWLPPQPPLSCCCLYLAPTLRPHFRQTAASLRGWFRELLAVIANEREERPCCRLFLGQHCPSLRRGTPDAGGCRGVLRAPFAIRSRAWIPRNSQEILMLRRELEL